MSEARAILACIVVLAAAAWTATAGASPQSRRIALTFDDAPRPAGALFDADERARRLVAALRESGVAEAMFFVKTAYIRSEADRERLRRYVAAGHRLANHSHSHRWLHRSDAAEYVADIAKASAVLRTFEGYDPFYRFPFLDEGRTTDKRDAVRKALDDLGLKHGYVTVDNYDWYLAARLKEEVESGRMFDRDALRRVYVEHVLEAVSFYDEIARDVLGRSPAHVLLLHENDLAALFVGDLVRALREAGWEIIPARAAYDDPIADVLPDTLFNGQGRVAAIAHARGRQPRELVQRSEDESYLDELLADRGVFSSTQPDGVE